MVRDLEEFDGPEEPTPPPRSPQKARIIASAVLKAIQLVRKILSSSYSLRETD